MHCSQHVDIILQDKTFKSLENLPIVNLKIRFATLRRADPFVFKGFQNMETLDLSDTRGMSVADLSETFQGLRSTKISTLILSSFKEWIDHPVELRAEYFSRLNSLHHLKRLYLDDTNIRITADWIALGSCEQLDFLTLARNRIGPDIFLSTTFIENLELILHLDLSFQRYIG